MHHTPLHNALAKCHDSQDIACGNDTLYECWQAPKCISVRINVEEGANNIAQHCGKQDEDHSLYEQSAPNNRMNLTRGPLVSKAIQGMANLAPREIARVQTCCPPGIKTTLVDQLASSWLEGCVIITKAWRDQLAQLVFMTPQEANPAYQQV